MAFIRYKKIGKNEYAYRVVAKWNKKTGKPYQVSEYLGRVIDKKKKLFSKQVKFSSMAKIAKDGSYYLEIPQEAAQRAGIKENQLRRFLLVQDKD